MRRPRLEIISRLRELASLRRLIHSRACSSTKLHARARYFSSLVLPDWRGFIVAWLSLVWIANVYMSVFARLRLEIKAEKLEIEEEESARRVDGTPEESPRERDDHRWSRHRSIRR